MVAAAFQTDEFSNLKTPSGPKGVPLLGHLLDMGRDTLGFFESCARTYGDVTALKLGAWPAMLVTDSDLIEQVLVKQHQKYIKNRFFLRQIQAVFGSGLFAAEGEAWQRQRKLSAPAFATKPLESYAPEMVALTERMIGNWTEGEPFDFYQFSTTLALSVAAKTLFGADLEEDIAQLDQAANWVVEEVASRFSRPIHIPDAVPLPGHVRYRRGIAIFEKMIHRIINEHRSGKKHAGQFMAQLMAARDDDGNPMTDVQLRDEVCNMLLAGYETTAIAIGWAFHLLGQDRTYQDRLAAEARVVAGSGDRPLSHEDLPKLKLSEFAVIETLRLYPPGWAIGREATEDVAMGSYLVPKGTTVIMSPWITQRDPENFADPLAFMPERWAGDFRKTLPRFAWFPFGGGPRVCIGSRFAMMEAMLILSTIARHYDVERAMEFPVKPIASVSLRPEGGVWVRARRRA